MSLTLYYHPLSSFCHKALIALYEHGTRFEKRLIDFSKEADRTELLNVWPVGKFPVIRDHDRGRDIPETSIIIDYLDRHFAGMTKLIPADADEAIDVRFWDRFFDLYVHLPMQKIVGDSFRPKGKADEVGVGEARATLKNSYGMIDRRMASRNWAAGNAFSMADCAAAPALFFANAVEPFPAGHKSVAAYFDRLAARPSYKRVLEEAKPYLAMFPFAGAIPERFR
jgi:glutathione S-transferase